MAIIKAIPGLIVQVLMNDKPLTEYADNDPNPRLKSRVITSFIEAIPEATFTVEVTFHHEFPKKQKSFRLQLELNGDWIDNLIVPHETLQAIPEGSSFRIGGFLGDENCR